MAVYNLTFKPNDVRVEVDTETLPLSGIGKDGSILDIAMGNGVEIEHACGGTGVCGTCMVEIESGAENLSEAEPDEQEMLEQRGGDMSNPRLACMAVVKGDVTVVVPKEA
ncbi:MAG: 2Fe-2S iron-sulfur cluster-binding protein [Phycisphaerae bacterium]